MIQTKKLYTETRGRSKQSQKRNTALAKRDE